MGGGNTRVRRKEALGLGGGTLGLWEAGVGRGKLWGWEEAVLGLGGGSSEVGRKFLDCEGKSGLGMLWGWDGEALRLKGEALRLGRESSGVERRQC